VDLSIVFPMFWGRNKNRVYEDGDYFYDHPTALDDDGTIPPLFESMAVLADRDFDVIAVAGANHPSMADAVESRAGELLRAHADRAGVVLHYFSYSQLAAFHDFLRMHGRADLIETVSLVGYSPLRNACLVAAHILQKEVAVSIDDDCLFIEPGYIARIKSMMLTEFEGARIRAYCGPYMTPKDQIYLDLPASPHSVYWNVVELLNEAFRKYVVESPRLKEVPFAIMGNIAVHRDFFTRCPLDPPMRRGEDMDWVMNAHILGERFVLDSELVIKHDPPSRPYPTWRPLREDIYRFRYQQAKIAGSREGDGHHALDRDTYLPYPGVFYQDDFMDRVTKACTILAVDYLSQGRPEDARQALANIHICRYGAAPTSDPYAGYLAFQKKWVELMALIDVHRDEIRQEIFP
jgi:hypothetical protein